MNVGSDRRIWVWAAKLTKLMVVLSHWLVQFMRSFTSATSTHFTYQKVEGVHSPVKVNDQLGDAYKQVVNSYGVRRQVGRTLCVCEGSTCMTCAKGAQGPRIKVYANNCQTWAQHRLLALARG